jgi:hypothetical protein
MQSQRQCQRAVAAYAAQLDEQLEAKLKLEQQLLATEHSEELEAWRDLLLETQGPAAAASRVATPRDAAPQEAPALSGAGSPALALGAAGSGLGAPGPPGDVLLRGQAAALEAARPGLEPAGARDGLPAAREAAAACLQVSSWEPNMLSVGQKASLLGGMGHYYPVGAAPMQALQHPCTNCSRQPEPRYQEYLLHCG